MSKKASAGTDLREDFSVGGGGAGGGASAKKKKAPKPGAGQGKFGRSKMPAEPVPAAAAPPAEKKEWVPVGKKKLRKMGGIVRSNDAKVVGEIVVKEWQRLPKQLLHEWSQKQDRPRPRYAQARALPGASAPVVGALASAAPPPPAAAAAAAAATAAAPPQPHEARYCARVILPDAKKSDRDINVCPAQAFASRQEADEYAALLALHQVAPALPLERKLPEPYAAVWLSLATARPALTMRSNALTQAERNQREQARRERENRVQARRDMKRLKDHVKVLMSERNRRIVEDVLRTHLEERSLPFPLSHGPLGAARVAALRHVLRHSADARQAHQAAAASLAQSGFAQQDAEEGASMLLYTRYLRRLLDNAPEARDLPERGEARDAASTDASKLDLADEPGPDDALDWLVMHVPEHRLPKGFDPRGQQLEVIAPSSSRDAPGAALASVDSGPASRSNGAAASAAAAAAVAGGDDVAAFLEAAGYPPAVAQRAAAEGSRTGENRTQVLFRLYREMCRELLKSEPPPPAADGAADLEAERADEEEALVAILGRDFQSQPLKDGTPAWQVKILVPDVDGQPRAVYIAFAFPAGCQYPRELPLVTVARSALHTLSSQQRLIVAQQAALHAAESSLLGSAMVYQLAEWLREKFHEVSHRNLVRVPSWSVAASAGPDRQPAGPPSSRHSGGRRGGAGPSSADPLPPPPPPPPLQGKGLDMLEKRRTLPAFRWRDELVRTVADNVVTVVCGETGCGKSTQVPQFLLEAASEQKRPVGIICTQPRRISALGLASRVAEERGERLGGTVGYSVRLEKKTSAETRLTYVTTGVLLRMLASADDGAAVGGRAAPRGGAAGRPVLPGVTHVVIDEVHERSTDIDFLLLILRELLRSGRRPDLRVVLMSATLDADLFAGYFRPLDVPVVRMEGRTFPVTEVMVEELMATLGYVTGARYRRNLKEEEEEALVARWYREAPPGARQTCERVHVRAAVGLLEDRVDMDLLEMAVFHLLTGPASGGGRGSGILVFLPGLAEISDLVRRLGQGLSDHGLSASGVWLLPLHSSIPLQDQQRVFLTPPAGVCKVVIATNIAETSITVEDVGFVIDSGRVKQLEYDPDCRMTRLVDAWVSRASATQRAGRAGRVGPGQCFRLYGHLRAADMEPQQRPEIQRTSLEHLVLQVKLLGLDRAGASRLSAARVLGLALEPPSAESVRAAVNVLRDLKALTGGVGNRRNDDEDEDDDQEEDDEGDDDEEGDDEEGDDDEGDDDEGVDGGEEEELLTPLGYHLARLPVSNVRLGKMLILGALFKCLSPVAAIAALMSERTPFLSPMEARDEANAARARFASGGRGDHLAALAAYSGWRRVRSERGMSAAIEWARENFVSWRTLETAESAAQQLVSCLQDIGFVRRGGGGRGGRSRAVGDGFVPVDGVHPDDDSNSGNEEILNAVLCGGLYPNVLRVAVPDEAHVQMAHGSVAVASEAREFKFFTRGEPGRVFLHPSSVNYVRNEYPCPWMVYLQMQMTQKVYVYDCTVVGPYALLLFGGEVGIDRAEGLVTVDGWIKFRAAGRIAVLVRTLRRCIDNLLLRKITDPGLDIASDPVTGAVLDLLRGRGY